MSAARDYVDLEVLVKKASGSGAGYEVRLTARGEAGPQEFSGYRTSAGTPLRLTDQSLADFDYGVGLFNWLFADPGLREAWGQLEGQHLQRRVRLWIDADAHELHAYPWEALCRPGHNGASPEPLALIAPTRFSRYLSSAEPPGKPIITRPLKMLVAVASPDDLKTAYNLDPIDAIKEIAALRQSLANISDAQLQITVLDGDCTLHNLATELGQGYHILHLICHGKLVPGASIDKPDQFKLYLADEHNHTDPVDGARIAQSLKQIQGRESSGPLPRLIFLSSCETARSSTRLAIGSLAATLVHDGTPAVIAMQDLVEVNAARIFATTFYEELMRDGLVDRAVNAARRQLWNHSNSDRRTSLAIPTLTMRLTDGRLFEMPGKVSTESSFWGTLLKDMKKQRCIVFIGPRIHDPTRNVNAMIARRMANELGYPLNDLEDLAQVARFGRLRGSLALRDTYLESAKLQLLLDDLGLSETDAKKGVDSSFADLLDTYKWVDQALKKGDDPYCLLADLPIGLYITTNIDNRMYAALAYRHRQQLQAATGAGANAEQAHAPIAPRLEVPRWNPQQVEALLPEPSINARVVFHLNGYDDEAASANPDHLILSEDQYLAHMINLAKTDEPLLPAAIGEIIAQSSLIFIGFALDDWEFRVILHGLLRRVALNKHVRHIGVQLDITTARGIGDNAAAAREYIRDFLHKQAIDVYEGTPSQFVNELHTRWKQQSGGA